MSAAAAAVDVTDAVPKKTGKKKLIIILAAVLLLVLAGGGAAAYILKKKAAEAAAAEEDGEGGHANGQGKKDERHAAPVFMPLDVFTVNLADREADRYAQIGITLEIEDSKVGEQIKAYLPAIRNNILMVVAHKTADQLIAREGKLRLASEVRREALRPLGIEVDIGEEPAEDGHGAAPAPSAADGKASEAARKKKKKTPQPETLPIKAVHFSSFIIQ